jgi:hypothetical protein
MAMWYIPAGSIPTTVEAKKRLEYLEKNGPTGFAFDFKKIFSPSDQHFASQLGKQTLPDK